jgi:hypothetical protein
MYCLYWPAIPGPVQSSNRILHLSADSRYHRSGCYCIQGVSEKVQYMGYSIRNNRYTF